MGKVSGGANQRVYKEKKKEPKEELDALTASSLNLNYLKHLDPIDRHLWWLALMVKLSLIMMVLGFLMVVA